MPEIISYHDNEQNVQKTIDTVGRLGIRKIANVLTIMVVLMALPVTLVAVRQISNIRQQASGSNLNIRTGALNASKQPYVVTLLGNNFNPLMKARMYIGDTEWGGDQMVVYENASELTVTLPDTMPPTGCDLKSNCIVKVQLFDPSTDFLSNKITLTVY